jgi:flagellar basal body-associated protein FliL
VELDLEGLRKEPPPPSEIPTTPVAPLAKNRRPIVLALVVVVMLLLGVFWLGYRSIGNRRMGGSPAKDPPQNVSAGFNPSLSAGTPVQPSFHLAPFFVPVPGNKKGHEVFLKVTVSLAFGDRLPSDEIRRKSLMIRSEITDVLLRRHLDELQSIEGKATLKQQIRDVVNRRLTQGTVRKVYFEEFFIL